MTSGRDLPGGLPPGAKPPTSHLVPSVAPQSKHHRSGAPLPGGHTVPGPGPGVVASSQPPSGSGGDRSFAAALRKLAKQAVPPSERECEGEPPPARQVSPKTRGPPPLVRGTSPTAGAAQESRKERALSHEQHVPRSSSRQDDSQLYANRTGVGGSTVEPPTPQHLARSGFQPYRPEEARLGHPPPAPGPPPPPFTLDPAAAAYSQYHHGLYPTHLQHAYSLEGQICLERCGMLRPPLFPPLPSSYHLYGLPRYPPEMLPTPFGLISPSMHERMKLEEEHRQRETQRLREEEKEREQEREREKERRDKARRSPRASPSHHQEAPARKAPITGVRERIADSSRKDVDAPHVSSRPLHPPPLIAPGSIPTPTAVTLPPPLHPIPNPPLDSELHQHSGKNLLTQQSTSIHLGNIPRLPYPAGGPSISSHHPHTSTPPSHTIPSHHPHTPTPPTLVTHHRLTTTPPHPASSHLQHTSTPPSHLHPGHSATPPHSLASHTTHTVTPPHSHVPHHPQHSLSSPASSHLSHHPHSHSSHYTSSQHSLLHQRTNSLSSSTTRNSKEQAFVRPFEDNFPQQHGSNRRSPIVAPTPPVTLPSPTKDRLASESTHVSSVVECVTNTSGIPVSKSHHHVHHHAVSSTNSVPPSNSLSVSVNSNKTVSVREEPTTQLRTTPSYSSSKDTNSDCVIQKVVTSCRSSNMLPQDGHQSNQINVTPSPLDLQQSGQTNMHVTSQSFQTLSAISQPLSHIPSQNSLLQPFHTTQSTGLSAQLVHMNQSYHPTSGPMGQDQSLARHQSQQPEAMQHVHQSLQMHPPASQTLHQVSLQSAQPPYQSSVNTSPIQHLMNREHSTLQVPTLTNHQTVLHGPTQSPIGREQPSHHSVLQLTGSTNHQPPPAVLNVPDAAKVLAAVSAKDGTGTMSVWDYHYLSKSITSQRIIEGESGVTPAGVLSKLDLAERRRKNRRNTLMPSPVSESDGEESDALVSMWLTKGPPSELKTSPKKLKFLGIFGLTTLSKRNECELRKLERRLARNPALLHVENCPSPDRGSPPLPLSLPLPRDSPDSLTRLADYKSKVRFLKGLGLDTLSRKDREEGELIWQAVLSERLRRKCINSVVVYCSRAVTKEVPTVTLKVPKEVAENSVLLKESDRLIRIIPDIMGRVRTAGSLKRPLSPASDKLLVLPSPGQNGTRPGYHLANIPTPSTLLLQNGVKRLAPDREVDGPDRTGSPLSDEERPRWPGLEEVMEAYQRYAQEQSLERCFLQERCARQCRQLTERRREADILDRRLRELVAKKSLQDYERHQTQKALDHLNACLRKLR